MQNSTNKLIDWKNKERILYRSKIIRIVILFSLLEWLEFLILELAKTSKKLQVLGLLSKSSNTSLSFFYQEKSYQESFYPIIFLYDNDKSLKLQFSYPDIAFS